MKTHDRPQFAKLMAVLGELYRKPLNENLIELYWVALERFDIQEVANAVNGHIQNPVKGTFMPQPADMIFYLEGCASTQAIRAWTKVYNAIRQIGAYRTVVFDDPLIHVTISDMGGWIKLCAIKEEEISYRTREFEKRYANYLLHKPEKYPKKLIGIIDAENNINGFESQTPLLLGEAEKALKVYLEGDKPGAIVQSKPLEFLDEKNLIDKQNLNKSDEKMEVYFNEIKMQKGVN